MSKHFMGSNAKIEVAISFDESSARITAAAKALAERTGMATRFVHVVEPFTLGLPARVLDLYPSLRDAAASKDGNAQSEAVGKLEKLASASRCDGPIETTVMTGEVATSVRADALVSNAALIMVGAGYKTYKYVPSGFSVALQLMAEANRPVMVVGADCKTDLASGRLKVLIADDLTPACEDVARTGIDLARALSNVDVLHLHVNTLTPMVLAEALVDVYRIGAVTDYVSEENIALGRRIEMGLEAELGRRVIERIPLLEARGGTYRKEIVTGEVLPELERAEREFGADIVVFGRHHLIRHDPFGIGKVTYREMLSQKRIVIVVPAFA